jgi:hypothetical protein
MISGFIFTFAGILWQFLSWILSFPAWFLLTYVIKIINLLHKIPFACLEIKIPWTGFLIFYLLLAYVIYRLKKINIQNF